MAGRVPPNFKTDVHRNPTKKWAAAPSYSYAGDDWGGYDEFDEYGSYDDPPEAPKPTGLRQRGQALPAVDTAPEQRSFSSASPSTAALQIARRGSFEYGDDRRAFSAGSRPPEQRYSPAKTEDSSTKPVHGLQKPSQDVNISPVNAYNPIQVGEITMGSPTSQQHGAVNRKPSPVKHVISTSDASVPAQSSAASTHQLPPISNVPKPPYNQSNFTPPPRKSSISADSQPPAQFPTRKSSLSQLRSANITQTKVVPTPASISPGQDAVGPTPAQPPQSTMQNTESAPRFVRPSDIYKRLDSEREKERQSSDSGRPSVDSINRAGAEVSGAARSQERDNSSNSGYLNASLSTVPERKSEYGLDGFSVTNPVLAQAIGAAVSPTHSDVRPAFSLPQLSRMSAFGDDFMQSSSTKTDSSQQPQPDTQVNDISDSAAVDRCIVSRDATVERQPSSGIRSAVEYAFDPQEDTSSARDDSQSSMLDSDLSRDSSTRDISPIMSRVPSAAPAASQGQERHRTLPGESTIIEDPREAPSSNSRPTSSNTLRGAATTVTGHSRGASADSATSIPSGYRRDLNAPNRENSPARRLEIQTEQHLPQGASGEMDLTTPSSKYSSNTTELGPVNGGSAGGFSQTYAANEVQSDSPVAIASASGESPISAIRSMTPVPDSQAKAPAQHSRTSSPGKTRVRDLANRYDENHSRSHSPVNSISSSMGRQRRQDTGGSLSSNAGSERSPGSNSQGSDPANLDLTRPQLPGSWVSYANSERSMTPDGSRDENQTLSAVHTPKLTDALEGTATPRAESEVPDFSPTNNRRATSSPGLSDNPLAALQAAGSAIGASLMSSVGLRTEADESETEGTDSYAPSEDDRTPEAAPRTYGNLQPRPIAAEQPAMSSGSSMAPTPPVKDTPLSETSTSSRDADYFPIVAPAPLKQRGTTPLATDVMRIDAPLTSQPTSSSSRRNMSLESSPEDTYNDRLRKDIARSLNTPTNHMNDQPTSIPTAKLAPGSTLAPPSPRTDAARESTQSTQSTVLPREYDSYWASTGHPIESRETSSSSSSSQQPVSESVLSVDQPSTLEPELRQAMPVKPSLGRHRYSWEAQEEDAETAVPAQSSTIASGALPGTATGLASSMDQPEEESAVRGASPSPHNVYQTSVTDSREVEPVPASATSYLVPKIDFGDEQNLRSSLEQTRVSQDEATSDTTRNISGHGLSDDYLSCDMHQSNIGTPTKFEQPVKGDTTHHQTSASGEQPKLVAFRDIMSIDSYSERLNTYNQTRDEFAGMDNGLSSWLSYMVAAHPENAEAVTANVKPMFDSGFASSVRSKLAPGMSKMSRSSPSGAASQPYYLQYLDSAGDLPSTSTAQLSSSPSQREPSQSRTTSGQHKSKDLLHSAGVFSGKATSSAKGLFAKGKSRFNKGGNEKDQSFLQGLSMSTSTSHSPTVAPPHHSDTKLELMERELESRRAINASGDEDRHGCRTSALSPQIDGTSSPSRNVSGGHEGQQSLGQIESKTAGNSSQQVLRNEYSTGYADHNKVDTMPWSAQIGASETSDATTDRPDPRCSTGFETPTNASSSVRQPNKTICVEPQSSQRIGDMIEALSDSSRRNTTYNAAGDAVRTQSRRNAEPMTSVTRFSEPATTHLPSSDVILHHQHQHPHNFTVSIPDVNSARADREAQQASRSRTSDPSAVSNPTMRHNFQQIPDMPQLRRHNPVAGNHDEHGNTLHNALSIVSTGASMSRYQDSNINLDTLPERSIGGGPAVQRSEADTSNDNDVHPLFRSPMEASTNQMHMAQARDANDSRRDTHDLPSSSQSRRHATGSPAASGTPLVAPEAPDNLDRLPPSVRNRYRRLSQSASNLCGQDSTGDSTYNEPMPSTRQPMYGVSSQRNSSAMPHSNSQPNLSSYGHGDRNESLPPVPSSQMRGRQYDESMSGIRKPPNGASSQTYGSALPQSSSHPNLSAHGRGDGYSQNRIMSNSHVGGRQHDDSVSTMRQPTNGASSQIYDSFVPQSNQNPKLSSHGPRARDDQSQAGPNTHISTAQLSNGQAPHGSYDRPIEKRRNLPWENSHVPDQVVAREVSSNGSQPTKFWASHEKGGVLPWNTRNRNGPTVGAASVNGHQRSSMPPGGYYDDMEQQRLSKSRSKSPWKAFRSRSRAASQDRTDLPPPLPSARTGAMTPDPHVEPSASYNRQNEMPAMGQGDDTRSRKRRSMSSWSKLSRRSRAGSTERDQQAPPVPLMNQSHETTTSPPTSYRHPASADASRYMTDSGEFETAKQSHPKARGMSSWKKFAKRSRANSLDGYDRSAELPLPNTDQSRHTPTTGSQSYSAEPETYRDADVGRDKRRSSVWSKFSRRSRGPSMNERADSYDRSSQPLLPPESFQSNSAAAYGNPSRMGEPGSYGTGSSEPQMRQSQPSMPNQNYALNSHPPVVESDEAENARQREGTITAPAGQSGGTLGQTNQSGNYGNRDMSSRHSQHPMSAQQGYSPSLLNRASGSHLGQRNTTAQDNNLQGRMPGHPSDHRKHHSMFGRQAEPSEISEQNDAYEQDRAISNSQGMLNGHHSSFGFGSGIAASDEATMIRQRSHNNDTRRVTSGTQDMSSYQNGPAQQGYGSSSRNGTPANEAMSSRQSMPMPSTYHPVHQTTSTAPVYPGEPGYIGPTPLGHGIGQNIDHSGPHPYDEVACQHRRSSSGLSRGPSQSSQRPRYSTVDDERDPMPTRDVTSQQGMGQNLTGQNLAGQNMSGQNTTGQQMSGQNMPGQGMTGQNLTDQNATGHNLTDRNQSDRNLLGSNVSGPNARSQNMTDQNILGQNMTRQQHMVDQPALGRFRMSHETTGQHSLRQNTTTQTSRDLDMARQHENTNDLGYGSGQQPIAESDKAELTRRRYSQSSSGGRSHSRGTQEYSNRPSHDQHPLPTTQNPTLGNDSSLRSRPAGTSNDNSVRQSRVHDQSPGQGMAMDRRSATPSRTTTGPQDYSTRQSRDHDPLPGQGTMDRRSETYSHTTTGLQDHSTHRTRNQSSRPSVLVGHQSYQPTTTPRNPGPQEYVTRPSTDLHPLAAQGMTSDHFGQSSHGTASQGMLESDKAELVRERQNVGEYSTSQGGAGREMHHSRAANASQQSATSSRSFPQLDTSTFGSQGNMDGTRSNLVAQHPGDTPVDDLYHRPRRQSTNREIDPMTMAQSQQQQQPPELPRVMSRPETQHSMQSTSSPPVSKRRSWFSSMFGSDSNRDRSTSNAASSTAPASPPMATVEPSRIPPSSPTLSNVGSSRLAPPSPSVSATDPSSRASKPARRRRSSVPKPPIEAGPAASDWSQSMLQSIMSVGQQSSLGEEGHRDTALTETGASAQEIRAPTQEIRAPVQETRKIVSETASGRDTPTSIRSTRAPIHRKQVPIRNAPLVPEVKSRDDHVSYLQDNDIFGQRPKSTVYRESDGRSTSNQHDPARQPIGASQANNAQETFDHLGSTTQSSRPSGLRESRLPSMGPTTPLGETIMRTSNARENTEPSYERLPERSAPTGYDQNVPHPPMQQMFEPASQRPADYGRSSHFEQARAQVPEIMQERLSTHNRDTRQSTMPLTMTGASYGRSGDDSVDVRRTDTAAPLAQTSHQQQAPNYGRNDYDRSSTSNQPLSSSPKHQPQARNATSGSVEERKMASHQDTPQPQVKARMAQSSFDRTAEDVRNNRRIETGATKSHDPATTAEMAQFPHAQTTDYARDTLHSRGQASMSQPSYERFSTPVQTSRELQNDSSSQDQISFQPRSTNHARGDDTSQRSSSYQPYNYQTAPGTASSEGPMSHSSAVPPAEISDDALDDDDDDQPPTRYVPWLKSVRSSEMPDVLSVYTPPTNSPIVEGPYNPLATSNYANSSLYTLRRSSTRSPTRSSGQSMNPGKRPTSNAPAYDMVPDYTSTDRTGMSSMLPAGMDGQHDPRDTHGSSRVSGMSRSDAAPSYTPHPIPTRQAHA